MLGMSRPTPRDLDYMPAFKKRDDFVNALRRAQRVSVQHQVGILRRFVFAVHTRHL